MTTSRGGVLDLEADDLLGVNDEDGSYLEKRKQDGVKAVINCLNVRGTFRRQH